MVEPKQEKLSEEIKVSIQNGVATIEHSDAYLAQRERFLTGEQFTRAEMAANENLIKSEDKQMVAAQNDPVGFLRQQEENRRRADHPAPPPAYDPKEVVQRLRADFSAAGLTSDQQAEIMLLISQSARKNAIDRQASSRQDAHPDSSASQAPEPVKSSALPPPLDIQRAVVGDGVKQLSATGGVNVDGTGLAGGVDYSQGFKHLQAGVGAGADDQGAVNFNVHAEKVIPIKDLPGVGDVVLYPYSKVGVVGGSTPDPTLTATAGALVVKTGELDLGLGEKNAVAGYVGAQSDQEGHVNAYASGSIALTKNLTAAAGANYDVAAANLTESLEVLYKVNKSLQVGPKVVTDEGHDTAIIATTNYRFGEEMQR